MSFRFASSRLRWEGNRGVFLASRLACCRNQTLPNSAPDGLPHTIAVSPSPPTKPDAGQGSPVGLARVITGGERLALTLPASGPAGTVAMALAPDGKHHLMVPIVVEYPVNWPYSPPKGHYANRQYFEALGGIKSGQNWHILSDRTMCLYHGSQWNDNNTIMHVIANRIAPHAFALLRMANGEESIDFFTTDYGYDM